MIKRHGCPMLRSPPWLYPEGKETDLVIYREIKKSKEIKSLFEGEFGSELQVAED